MAGLVPSGILLRIAGFVFFLCLAIVWLFMQPQDLGEWLRVFSAALSVGGICLFVTAKWLWRPVWRCFPVLDSWFFPDLNGDWKVVMDSNIVEIAKHRPDIAANDPPRYVHGTARIRQDFLQFSITVHIPANDSNSRTVIVKPERVGDRFVLHYVYDGVMIEPTLTDEGQHLGAGRISCQVGSHDRLVGHYWTNRRWQDGSNTAGIVTFSRNRPVSAEAVTQDKPPDAAGKQAA